VSLLTMGHLLPQYRRHGWIRGVQLETLRWDSSSMFNSAQVFSSPHAIVEG
jgi:hypothetical protein